MVSTFIKLTELQKYFIQRTSKIQTPQIVTIHSSTDPQLLLFLSKLYQNITFRVDKCLVTEMISKDCTDILAFLDYCDATRIVMGIYCPFVFLPLGLAFSCKK